MGTDRRRRLPRGGGPVLANGLDQRGVKVGYKVAVLCRNHAGLVTCFIARAELGADIVLLNTGQKAGRRAGAVARLGGSLTGRETPQ